MPVDGLTPDDYSYITTPDGIRVPRSLASPEAVARFTADNQPTPEQQKKADEEGAQLKNNLLTTAGDMALDSYKAMIPGKNLQMAVQGVGDLAEKGAELGSDARKALGIPMFTYANYLNMKDTGSPFGKSTVLPAQQPPPGSPPSTPQAMALQAAMGAGGAPGDSFSVKANAGVTPQFAGYGGVRKEMDAAAKAQEGSAQRLGDIAAQRAAAAAGEQEGRARQMEQEQLRSQAIEQRAQQVSYDQIGKAETLQNELRKLSDTKIDPNHFWADKSTGDRFTAAFAVFLGGLGDGPNKASEILQHAIDRDIDAQKSNWDHARQLKVDQIEGQRNIYGMYRNALGDERAAEAAARAQALDMFNQRLTATAAKYDSPEIQERAKAAQAAIQQQLAGAHKQLLDAVNESAYKKATIEMQSAELGLRTQQAQTAARAKQLSTYVPGVGVALDEESKKKVQEAAGAYNETKSALEEMKRLRKAAGGGEIVDRDLVKQMKSAQTAFIGAMNRMEKFGALDKGAQDVLSQFSGGDITDFGSSIDSALEQAGKTVDNSFRGQTKPYMAQYEEAAQPITSFAARK